MDPAEIGNGSAGSEAGGPLSLSISDDGGLRAIGFDLSRDLLVMWEYTGGRDWDAEALPISEDDLIRDHLSVATAPDGDPCLAAARFNGMSWFDLLWYSYRSGNWEVSVVSTGLHRLGVFNSLRMVEAVISGAVPHLVFAAFDSGGEQAVLWDAIAR
ncbi:hypothetical protein ACFL6R_00115 [Gemmatimonadota bacterium]